MSEHHHCFDLLLLIGFVIPIHVSFLFLIVIEFENVVFVVQVKATTKKIHNHQSQDFFVVVVLTIFFFIALIMLTNKFGWMQPVATEKKGLWANRHPLRYFFLFMLLFLSFTTLNFYNNTYYNKHLNTIKHWPKERIEHHSANPLVLYNWRIVKAFALHDDAPRPAVDRFWGPSEGNDLNSLDGGCNQERAGCPWG